MDPFAGRRVSWKGTRVPESVPTKLGLDCVALIDATRQGLDDDAFEAAWWAPIAMRWPSYVGVPRVHRLAVSSVRGSGPESFGAAVVIVADDETDLDALFPVVDALWECGHSGVILVSKADDRWQALSGRGIVVLERGCDPVVIAATLAALCERQPAMAAVQTELRIARRFQGGLRGEMDKIHDELQLAASVQRELLPRSLPLVTNIGFHVLFRPAGYVSGDIYDVQPIDEHRVGFFIADAVGHGVPAALMTMLLARSLSMRDAGGDKEIFLRPSLVLERLNKDMISRHSDVPRFATAVYGVVDTRDRSVVLASAGHPRPLRIRDGVATAVEMQGGLLGVFAEDTFDEASFTLAEDEMLVLFSDGFETAFPDPTSDQYGRRLPTQRFLDAFKDSARVWRERGGAAAMGEVARALDQEEGSLHQIDDLTAIMVVPCKDRALDALFSAQEVSGSFGERSGGAEGLQGYTASPLPATHV